MSSSVTCQLNNKAYKQNLVKKRTRMKIKRIENRRRTAIPKNNGDWVLEFDQIFLNFVRWGRQGGVKNL